MKILININSDGGLYNFRRELLERFIREKNELTIIVPFGIRVNELRDIGCDLIDLPINRHSIGIYNNFNLLFTYAKMIKSIKPDVILNYTIKPNIYGGIVAQIKKIPYISNITGLGTAVEKGGLLKKVIFSLYKIALKKSRCVFFQNESNMNLFINEKIVKNEKSRLIPGSGVNLEFHKFEEYPDEDGTIRFLFIGRLMVDKGVRELIEAAKIIKTKYDDVEFDLIGSCEDDFKEEFKKLNENDTVNWHGMQTDVHLFIKNHHATILPSYHEGMANVLLESASSGRPVLASNIPGCYETFDEGVSGFGFKKKNVDSLVETIEKFIELPYGKKVEMGIAGRKKMEKEFDRNIIIKSYMEEIDKIGK